MGMNTDHLIKGRYYWIYVRVMDMPGTWQPARFTGIDGDSTGRATWDYIGLPSAEGHHWAEVKDIGREISL